MRVPFARLGPVVVSLVLVLVLALPSGWLGDPRRAWAQGRPQANAAPIFAQTSDELALGIIVDTTNPRSMQLAREAGFTHAKMIVHWPRLEPERGRYTFAETSENDLDNVMKAARTEGIKLVVRVDGVPDWNGGSPARAEPQAVEAFYAAVAAHGKGTIVGYEILNEPNLPVEWGGDPSPQGYTAFVKAAYRGVKKSDPSALVIAGGPSPNTGGFGGTIEDTDFLRGMYAAGVKGHMDALAVHNYGGNHAPERDPGDCGICFRRAEIYRQLMVEQGDASTPIWSTEFGWLMDPGHDMGQYDWMKVSPEQQAEYVVRSYQYAQQNWPWMEGMLLSNLDASTSPYHTGPQNGMPWFAILNKDHSPRPAWKAFKAWREQERERPASRPRAATAARQSSGQHAAPSPVPVVSEATPTPTANPEVTPTPNAASSMPAPALPAQPTPDPGTAVAPAPSSRLKVAGTDGVGANLRDRPSADGRVIAILMDGTAVDVIGEDVQAEGRTWKHVRTTGSTTDGVTGWVASQLLVP